MDLTLRHRRLPGVSVIAVRGELDLLTAGLLEERLQQLRRRGDEFVLDLAGTSFIDCSGVGALMRTHHRMRQGGGRLHLAAPQPGPARVIRFADLDAVLAVRPSVEHAIGAAFNDHQQTSRRLIEAAAASVVVRTIDEPRMI
ncbi:STAS domain-containing protein [Actinoallomurus acaciae]|uniref:Anti-sigma factor antagonist n=1 Tax=Actinoallomurus acaciae TaxID=502577 RepID=A0ABV5Y7T3_9ACTN